MKSFLLLVSILVAAMSASAAPDFEGPGCKEDGTGCFFGTPSHRVANWFEDGSVEKMGDKCEKFLSGIKEKLARYLMLKLKLKKQPIRKNLLTKLMMK
jgi:opacity protein-like surface antigen